MKPHTFTARVTSLVARAERPPIEAIEDAPDKRLKIQFQTEPDEDTKKLLISHGFRYRAGTTAAWCRKLDNNARQAARLVMAQLTDRTEEDNL